MSKDINFTAMFSDKDYSQIANKPTLNGVPINGKLTSADLKIAIPDVSKADVATSIQAVEKKISNNNTSINDRVTKLNQYIQDCIAVNYSSATNQINSMRESMQSQFSNVYDDINMRCTTGYADGIKTQVEGRCSSIEAEMHATFPHKQDVLVAGSNITITKNNPSDDMATVVSAVVPTKTSELTNDSKYQSDSDVSTAIASAVSKLTQIKYEIVSELPATGAAGVIYLMNNSSATQNIYKEYLYVGTSYEELGPSIDLTNINTAISDLQINLDKANANISTKTSTDTFNSFAQGCTTAMNGMGASVNANTEAISSKQDALTAGSNITITDNKISATVPTLVSAFTNDAKYQTATEVSTAIAGKQDKLTAGTGISIKDGIISCTSTAVDGTEESY